jgi:glycosyltransferase involved in cell wall biosynthesis
MENRLRLADKAARARDWREAVRLYRQILKTLHDDVAVLVQYGHALKESGDRLQAEAAYRRSLVLDPDLPDTHLQLGHVLKLQGRLDEAAIAYLQALILAPTFRHAARELAALGWTPSRITTAQRKARQGLHNEATCVRTARTIVFDVSDLMQYFQEARIPTGIQRVQMRVISSALQNPGITGEIAVACFTTKRDFWIEIPHHLFLELATLALSGGTIEEPAWQDALVEFNTHLNDGADIEFAGGETLVNLGTSWWLQNYFLMVRLAKAKYGVRYVPFFHDLIPLITPEHCSQELTQDFISWLIGAFFHADGYLVNSNATAADLKKVAQILGHKINEPQIVRLDGRFDLEAHGNQEPGHEAASPADIEVPRGPFVLFVGTIESRKNHLLAFNVWLELIKKRGERRTPTLVCVGKDGWMREAAMARLNASSQLQRRVRIMQKVSDRDLARLYRGSLFTIYPSSYEGWGLPITESLCFGKVVVTTTLSSLPEVGGEFAEYFDLQSMRDMLIKVERLIDDHKHRRGREAKIRSEFKSRNWAEIAEEIVRRAIEVADECPRKDTDDTVHWVWPLPVEIGRYYSLARNRQTIVWPRMIGGEMYRMGTRWFAPEDWGTWTKGGLARIAFHLPADGSSHILYISLLGPPLIKTSYRIRLLDADAKCREGELQPGEARCIAMRIPGRVLRDGLIHIGIEAEGTIDLGEATEGRDRRLVSLGVRGFYLCREDDLFGRWRFIEALQLNDLEGIGGRPDEPVGITPVDEECAAADTSGGCCGPLPPATRAL